MLGCTATTGQDPTADRQAFEASEQCEAIIAKGPPPTRRGSIVDELHGVAVPDPYRWLEDITSGEVRRWTDAQDTFARATLSGLPRREALAHALREKIDITTTSVPIRRGNRTFFARRHAGHDHFVWYVRDGDGPERVVLDPLTLDPNGRATIRRPVPSPNGRLLAYLVSYDGADEATLHLYDVDERRTLPDDLGGARYASAAWRNDSKAFAYTYLPDDEAIAPPELPSHAEVRVHRVGTSQARDVSLYGPLGDAATFVGVQSVDDGHAWVLSLQHDWSATDLYLRSSDDTTRGANLEGWRPLFVGQDALASVSAYHGRYFIHTNAGAPRFRVIEVDPARPQAEHWREVVPEGTDTLESADVFGGRLLLQSLRRASSRLEIRELSGQPVADVSLDGPTSVAAVSGSDDDDAVFVQQSALHRAPRIDRLSMRSGELRTWDTVELPLRDDLTVEQVWVTSADGTKVSMFVLHQADLDRERPHPTLLTGYGGFGVAMRPGFSAIAALWAERGGVWAVANLRGGGEYGEAWHEAGRRAHKQNTFDDFFAAATFLHEEGYSTPASLAIRGGSNGGLLMGAASTQRPELFAAVVCAVPLLDMLRYHRFGSGPTWVGEYGSPEDAEQFGWLWGYSPLHKVRPGVAYPPLLMLSADNDDRVDPMHARKYVAAMQHAGAHALLRVERGAGHGGSPRVADRIDAEVDTLAFLLAHLGAPG